MNVRQYYARRLDVLTFTQLSFQRLVDVLTINAREHPCQAVMFNGASQSQINLKQKEGDSHLFRFSRHWRTSFSPVFQNSDVKFTRCRAVVGCGRIRCRTLGELGGGSEDEIERLLSERFPNTQVTPLNKTIIGAVAIGWPRSRPFGWNSHCVRRGLPVHAP